MHKRLICGAIMVFLSLMPTPQGKADYEKIKPQTPAIDPHKEILKEMFGTEEPNIKKIEVTATSYNPVRSQCDDRPLETADGSLVAPGMLGVSRDLLRKHKLHVGQKVVLQGLGTFTVTDKMNHRFRNRVDIISFIPQWSKKFGKRQLSLYYSKS